MSEPVMKASVPRVSLDQLQKNLLRDLLATPQRQAESREEITPLTAADFPPDHPVLTLHCLWSAMAHQDLPRREAFNPMRVPKALPWLTLFERMPGPQGVRYVVRIDGTMVVQMLGEDWTGTELADHFHGAMLEWRIREFDVAITEKRPILSRARIFSEGQSLELWRGVFPFYSQRHGCHHIMLVSVPQ